MTAAGGHLGVQPLDAVAGGLFEPEREDGGTVQAAPAVIMVMPKPEAWAKCSP